MFDVICINDSNRPNEIPTSKWVVNGNRYFVIEVGRMLIQGGLLGFKLAEISLDGCEPYQFYAASRFGITQEMLQKMIAEKKIVVKEQEETVSEPV
jgi:hypothetical protein